MWYSKRLKPEQKQAVDFIIENKTVALFSQQRTGKTYISLSLLERITFKLVLIVAPRTAVDAVWRKNLKKLDCFVCLTLEETRAAIKIKKPHIILVVSWKYFVNISKRAAKLPFDVIIIDESQGLKARNSHQSRAARRFRDVGTYRIALSGTPIDESPIDVWAQMRFVKHTVLSEDWSDFADQFCKRGGFMGYKWVFRKDRHSRLLKILKPYIYRLTVDFLKLPPVEIYLHPFHLLGNQARLYQEMAEEGYIKVNEQEIVAPLPVTKQVKLSQITGGSVLTEEDEDIEVGRAKERKLRSLLPRLGKPLVVFCQFLHEFHTIRRVLKAKYKRIDYLYGKVKGKDRSRFLERFERGEIDAAIAQLRTGGVAIDLTRSSELVLFSINHSFIDFEQVLFRLRGMNQRETLKVHILYALDTVDEEKVEVIEHKKSEVYKVVSHFERK